MRLFVGQSGDDRAVIVLPLRDRDLRILTRGRAAPLRADHQRGAQHRPIRQRNRNTILAALPRDDLGAFVPDNIGFGPCGLEQSEAQLAIGEHPTQRTFMRFGREIDPAGLHLVRHRDRFDRADCRGSSGGIARRGSETFDGLHAEDPR